MVIELASVLKDSVRALVPFTALLTFALHIPHHLCILYWYVKSCAQTYRFLLWSEYTTVGSGAKVIATRT